MSEREMTAKELVGMVLYFGSIVSAVYITLWLVGVPL